MSCAPVKKYKVAFLQINLTRCTILLSIFISLPYMFRQLQPADQTTPMQSNKYQCRTDTVISPDYGHVDGRNMQRREINILSNIVHLVGFICKIAPLYFFGRTPWISTMVVEINNHKFLISVLIT